MQPGQFNLIHRNNRGFHPPIAHAQLPVPPKISAGPKRPLPGKFQQFTPDKPFHVPGNLIDPVQHCAGKAILMQNQIFFAVNIFLHIPMHIQVVGLPR